MVVIRFNNFSIYKSFLYLLCYVDYEYNKKNDIIILIYYSNYPIIKTMNNNKVTTTYVFVGENNPNSPKQPVNFDYYAVDCGTYKSVYKPTVIPTSTVNKHHIDIFNPMFIQQEQRHFKPDIDVVLKYQL